MNQVTSNLLVETGMTACNLGCLVTSAGVVMIDTPRKPSTPASGGSRPPGAGMERIRHYAGPLVLAVFGWRCVSFLTRPEVRMFGVICAVVAALGAQPIFWSIPARVIPPKARPVGIAFISSCGMVAGATRGMVLGFFRDLTHTWVASLMFVTGMLLMSAVLVFLMPPEQAAAPERTQAQSTPG